MVGASDDAPMVERMQRWLEATQRRRFPYPVAVLGLDFVVERGVFSPAYYSETAFFARHVRSFIRRGDRYLDLGCGVGVTAVLAARQGARVVALDVNPAAVANTRTNALLLGVGDRVDVRESDVFSALGPGEQFDVAFWNVPFTFRDAESELTVLEEAIFDPGHRKLDAFLAGVGARLRPGGTVLLGASSSLGSEASIERAAGRHGWVFELVAADVEAGHRANGPRLELLRARSSAA